MNYFGLKRLYKTHGESLIKIASDVWATGKVLLGPHLEELETSLKKFTQRKYAIGVGSATDGIFFALKANGIGRGHKVICPVLSYTATRDAILRTGADIIFIDTDHKGRLNLNDLPKADAIVYVNLYGNPLDYDKLKSYGTLLVEDGAQSMGASYKNIPSGKLGDISIFSFDPTKNLPCFGSGGMVFTDDENIATSIIKHRKGFYNSVLAEDHAAQLNYLLSYFDYWQEERRLVAQAYFDLLPQTNFIKPDSDTIGGYQKLVVTTDKRKEGFKIHYKETLDPTGIYPNADRLPKTVMSLPIHPFLTYEEIENICLSIRQ